MSLSNYAEGKIAEHLVGKTSWTMPTTVYVALHTGDPGETGASNECAGGSYARQAVTWGSQSGGVISNSVAAAFAGMPAATVTHVSLWDASSGGNCLAVGPLGGSRKLFTCDATTDVVTSPGHGLADGNRIQFDNEYGGSIPGGLSAGTVYYVRDSTTNDFKVASTAGGSAIDLTTTVAGVVLVVSPKVVQAGDTVNFATTALSFTAL